MAKPTITLIDALKKTANKLKAGAPYQWGHMGSCNCGSLAQEIAHISKSDIHEYAMRSAGSWEEQSFAYCPTSGYPMDLLITTMLQAGLELEDLKHLEKLSDLAILKRLPQGKRYLKHNVRDDVVVYLKTWARMLEERLVDTVELAPFYTEPAPQTVGK